MFEVRSHNNLYPVLPSMFERGKYKKGDKTNPFWFSPSNNTAPQPPNEQAHTQLLLSIQKQKQSK